jgi:hypothetical protein
MSKRGTWHGVLSQKKKKNPKAGAKVRQPRQKPKPQTALVPAGANLVHSGRVCLPVNIREQTHTLVLDGLRHASKQSLRDTFNENMSDLAEWLARGDAFGRAAHWAIGRRLHLMLEKGSFGDGIVEKATKSLGYQKSLLYCCLAYYRSYPSVGQASRLDELGLDWTTLRELLRIEDVLTRDKIISALEAARLSPEQVAGFVKKQVRKVLKPAAAARKKTKAAAQSAEAELQNAPLAPLGYFRKLNQMLALQWEPVRQHLEQLGVVKAMLLDEKTGNVEESIQALADCRREVRRWQDNLAVIARLADSVAEPDGTQQPA